MLSNLANMLQGLTDKVVALAGKMKDKMGNASSVSVSSRSAIQEGMQSVSSLCSEVDAKIELAMAQQEENAFDWTSTVEKSSVKTKKGRTA